MRNHQIHINNDFNWDTVSYTLHLPDLSIEKDCKENKASNMISCVKAVTSETIVGASSSFGTRMMYVGKGQGIYILPLQKIGSLLQYLT
jgi:hypothetical protein